MERDVETELDRFRDAQAASFDTALDELRAGRKRSHWIWYVFPQIAGLGQSPMAQRYAIRDLDEAEDYLRDGVLRARLLAAASVVAEKLEGGAAIATLMGSGIDALKLVSSMTLFAHVADRLARAEGIDACRELAATAKRVLVAAAKQGIPPCEHTRSRLAP